MADEIVTIQFRKARSGSHWSGFFLDDLVPPITTPAGVAIPISPSSSLGDLDRLSGIFTDAELLAFDNGEKMFTGVGYRLTQDEDSSAAALRVRLRAEYAATDRVAQKRREWRFYGRRVDAI
jgi:hypothetical protein